MSSNSAEGRWRIVIFTVYPGIVPEFKRVINEREHRLVALFTAPGPRIRRTDDYRGVSELASPSLDVVVSNQPARWANLLSAYRPDLVICIGYNWKLPGDVLKIPRLGAINFHAALLPRYRGPNSFAWALRNADPEVGWTVHYMTEGLDDGPILAQRSMSLSDDDDIDTLWEPYWALTVGLLDDALERVAAGDPGTPQDESLASDAPRFLDEYRQIDWRNPAREIHLQVRSRWGHRGEKRGAVADIDGITTRIVKTQLSNLNGTVPFEPGTVLERDGEELLVQCGDIPLRILKSHPEPSAES